MGSDASVDGASSVDAITDVAVGTPDGNRVDAITDVAVDTPDGNQVDALIARSDAVDVLRSDASPQDAPTPCAPNPCNNGGMCTVADSMALCMCPPGFSGSRCETDIDECSANPCMNGGTCADGVGSFTCACPAGFSGARCETNIDDCAPNPCANGGACTDGVASFSCVCARGFTGMRCETNIDDCAPNPCLNGGTCIDGVASYSCMCPSDTGGTRCECAAGAATTLSYTNRGNLAVMRIDDTGMTVTGSSTIRVAQLNGLGIEGGAADDLVDGAEHIEFTGNAARVSYLVRAAFNFNGNGMTGEAVIEAFDLGGASLGTRAVDGAGGKAVSTLFGDVPISRFRVTANIDGFRIDSVSFRPWICP